MQLHLLGLSALFFSLGLASFAQAVSIDGLSEQEKTILQSIRKRIDPLIEERKRLGNAPLTTFEELYTPLGSQEIAFLEEIRGLDPAILQGSSRKLPPPSPQTEFVRLEPQVILQEGKPILLDPQYLPRQVYESYLAMMVAMEEDLGKRLLVESGYRSPAYQLYLFLYYMPKHGHSIRETNRHVALPGCSEHGSPAFQAIDFITPHGINGEDRPEEFEELQEYGWLHARAHEFGFHLSYPRKPKPGTLQKGTLYKSSVSPNEASPWAFEPWHWHHEVIARSEIPRRHREPREAGRSDLGSGQAAQSQGEIASPSLRSGSQ